MKKEVLIDNDDVSLVLYPEDKILHHTIKREIEGSVFRNLLIRGLYELTEKRADKWLSDDREAGPLSADDLAWTREFFQNKASLTNWQYFAILLPQNPRARISIGSTVSTQDAPYLTDNYFKVFEDVDEALSWLKSVR